MKKLAVVLVCAMPLGACYADGGEAQALPVKVVAVGQSVVRAEVADTDAERELGLMYRKTMPEDAGMLFTWKEPGRHIFWMKNTLIPLDMVFARGGKVVGIVNDAKPMDETSLDVGVDSDSVLEVNAGWVKAHNVKVGAGLVVRP